MRSAAGALHRLDEELEGRWIKAGPAVELVTNGVGGEGVGRPGDRGGEHFLGVGKTRRVEDEGPVVVPTAGRAHVNAGTTGAGLYDADGVVGGDALAA
jgi:hypothetical protein